MFRINKILQLVIAACLLITSTIVIAQTWTPLNGPQIATNVKDISLSGNFVYIAENDYLLKSTNGGTAWKGTTTNFTTPSVVLCKPDNSNIVIASRQDFFKLSIDGGATWGNVTPSTIIDYLTPIRLSASQVSTSNMFLGRKYDGITSPVWRSMNTNGAEWSQCVNFGPEQGVYYQTDVYDIAPYPVGGVGRDNELWVCGSKPAGSQQPSPRMTTSISSTSGIWFSTNSGTNWQAYTMGDFNITSIAVAHKSTPYLYAGTSDGDIYRSVNYGVDWALSTSIGYNIRMIRVNQTNGYVFAATENGIQRSLDDGANWSSANNGFGSDIDVYSISVLPSSNTVFAGTTGALYKSTDNGNTWVKVTLMKSNSADGFDENNILAVNNDNSYVGKYQPYYWINKYLGNAGANFSSNHVYRDPQLAFYAHIAGSLNGLPKMYRTTDMGANFESCSIPSISSGKFNGTVRKWGTSDLYLFGGANVDGIGWKNLFKSINNGLTWEAVSFTLGGSNIYINDFAPTTPQILIAALSDGRIMRSGDNGQYWTNPYSVGSAAKSLAWNQSYPNVIYAAGSNGLYKSIDGGSNWSSKRLGDIKKVILSPGYPTSTDHVLILTADGTKIHYSSDGGTTWSEVQGNLPTPINDIRGISGTTPVVYAATNNGVYKIVAPTAAPQLVSPVNNTNTDRIVPTLVWNPVTNAAGYRLQVSKSSTFNVLMTNQQLSSTTYIPTYLNNGTTYYWRVLANNFLGQTSYSSVYQFTATALTSETITLSGSKYWDGADYHPQLTWSTSTSNTPPFYVYRWYCSFEEGACWPNDQLPIVITNNTTLIDYSVVAGDKTDLYNGSYYYVVKSASISAPKSFYVDGSGDLEWKVAGPKELEEHLNNIPLEYKLDQNIPNPFNPTTTVNYQLPSDNYVTIKVYNILGEEVTTLVDGFKTAGYKTVRLDASHLANGVYYYSLHAGNFTDVKKMILIK